VTTIDDWPAVSADLAARPPRPGATASWEELPAGQGDRAAGEDREDQAGYRDDDHDRISGAAAGCFRLIQSSA
jgi:hypothetical protein